MTLGSAVLYSRRTLSAGLIVIAGILSGCETLLMTPEEPQPEQEPDVLIELRDRLAACESRLDSAIGSRDDTASMMAAQGAMLVEVQGALLRVETRLNEQKRVAREAKPVQACEPQVAELPRKLLVGRREKVWIEPLQMTLPARIDTGAETASIDARNIEDFERNGKPWVRFDIVHPETGEAISMEHEVVRFVRILQSSTDKAERRAVIEMGVVIGDIRQEAEFTLSNRSHLDFQVLVGRNILRDMMIVDVGQSNIAAPRLPRETAEKPAASEENTSSES